MDFRKLKDKKICILGFGKEGQSTFQFLRKLFPKSTICVADEKPLEKLDVSARKLIKNDKNVREIFGPDYLNHLGSYDIIFKSPGIPIGKLPRDAKITSQTEVFLEKYRDKIIGVTGTKGKSTTSSLIYHLLKKAGIKVQLVGNIGAPPFDSLGKDREEYLYVYELSSYQLEKIKISPHIAVVLNLFKEHLDYHKGYQKYLEAKSNITKWQTGDDYLIFNKDETALGEIVKNSKAKKITFSLHFDNTDVHMDAIDIYFRGEKILPKNSVPLLGRHNLNNIEAAIAVAKLFDIKNNAIALAIKTFKPLNHRLEYVGEVNNIKFFNDSISTIPEATIGAIEALRPGVSTLILGGYDRGLDFKKLAKTIMEEKIENLILFPETGQIILDEIKKIKGIKLPHYIMVDNMKKAVNSAMQITTKGKVCLLSPASPSFNLFANYIDRGDQFTREIQNYKG